MNLYPYYPNHKKHINHTNTMIEIKVAFTQKEYAIIENAARRHGMTVEEFVHYAITCDLEEMQAS